MLSGYELFLTIRISSLSGSSHKVSEREPTGLLSLCFYVEKKLSKRNLGCVEADPARRGRA